MSNTEQQARAAFDAPTQAQGDYPVLPEPPMIGTSRYGTIFRGYSADQMRAYVDADRAARSGQVSDEPVATVEVIEVDDPRLKPAHHVALHAKLPHGTKLYTRPGPSKEVVEALEKCVQGLDHLDRLCREWEPDYASGDDRAKWVHARDAANLARAALRSLGGEHG